MPSRHKRLGPFSRDVSLATLDQRTRAGRVYKNVVADLTSHIGDPTPGQRLLIMSAAVKATRLALLTDMLLSGKVTAESSDAHALAFMNGLRHDVVALGLERKAPKSIALTDYLNAVDADVTP